MDIQSQLEVSGVPVDLSVVDHPVSDNSYVVRAVDANDPENFHEHVVTLGPVSGGILAVPTQADFQQIIDDARQVAASHVAFRAAISSLEANIK